MCKDILEDKKNSACKFVEDVEYSLPNKHYIPIDLGFIGLKNLANDDAEVFLPASHPR
jgi:urate oxidase